MSKQTAPQSIAAEIDRLFDECNDGEEIIVGVLKEDLEKLVKRHERQVEDKIVELCEAPSCSRCHGPRVPVRSVTGVVTAYCPKCDVSRVSNNEIGQTRQAVREKFKEVI